MESAINRITPPNPLSTPAIAMRVALAAVAISSKTVVPPDARAVKGLLIKVPFPALEFPANSVPPPALFVNVALPAEEVS